MYRYLLFILFVLCFLFTTYIISIRFYPSKRASDLNDAAVKSAVKSHVQNTKSLNSQELFSLADIVQYGKFEATQNFQKSIQLFKQSIAKSNDTKHIGECYLRIGKIYYEMKNATASIDNYLHAIEYGYEEGIILISKIYMYGIHPYIIADKITAAKILSRYMHMSNSLSKWCQFYLHDLHSMSYNDIDTLSYNTITNNTQLPFDIIDKLDYSTQKMIENNVISYGYHINDNWVKDKIVGDKSPEDHHDDDIDTDIPKHRSIITTVPKQTIVNDTQNVHDHVLQNTANSILKILDSNSNSASKIQPNSFQKDYNDFVKRINLDVSDDENCINRTIKSFSELKHSRYDKSEKEVFSLVWNKIKDNDDLVAIFNDNLASSVEDDVVVCSTGKIMRMISTLDSIDDTTPDLKPTWAIRNELANIVSAEIKNTLNTFDTEHKDAYNAYEPTTEQIPLLETVTLAIKSNIVNKCKESYVKQNIISEPILMLELDEFLQHI